MKEIATIKTTEYILEKYNLRALKKFGQNFLIDSNIVEKIVSSERIDEETCVIEIGPGIGAMTQILQRSAGKVVCFEIDERFKDVYQEFLNFDNVEINFTDFLTVDIAVKIEELKQNYSRVLIVANIPYYITTKIIEKVIESGARVDAMVLMVQKEVALKFTSKYKNPIIMMVDYLGKSEYLFTVSKNVFIPKPRVDSAILKITIEKEPNNKLLQLLEVCFKQRRKTIYNNLKQEYPDAREILEKSQIAENMRSEQLKIGDYLRILAVIGENDEN